MAEGSCGDSCTEDHAPAPVPISQQEIDKSDEVQRILWRGKSRDVDMIEPAWTWVAGRSRSGGAPETREEAIRAWKRGWNDVPQTGMQGWIEGIVRDIQRVMEVEGGKEYGEGRSDDDERQVQGQYRPGTVSVGVFYDEDGRGVGGQSGEGEGREVEMERVEDGFEDVEEDGERTEYACGSNRIDGMKFPGRSMVL